MTVYVYDKKLQKVVPKGSQSDSGARLQIIKDIEPYKSMATGERITSRSRHREHLQTYDLVEVGNEKMESRPTPLDHHKRREAIAQSLGSMTDSQAGEIMQQLANQYGRR